MIIMTPKKNKSFIKQLIFALAFCLCFIAVTDIKANAYDIPANADIRTQGVFTTNGNQFTWVSFRDENWMTTTVVSGNGGFREDYDFDCYHSGEWSPFVVYPQLSSEYLSNILVFEEGITNIPDHLLDGWVNGTQKKWANISRLYLPKSMTSISNSALWMIRGITTIYCYPESEAHKFCEEHGYNYSLIIDSSTLQKPVVTAPVAKKIEYDGKAHPLVKAGSTTAGTMYYGIEENYFGYSKINYSAEIPTASEIGDYKVYYKVEGDYTVEATTPQYFTVSIKPAKAKISECKNTSDGVFLSWKKVKGAAGYYVYRDGVHILTISSADTTSCYDSSSRYETEGTKHKYQVAAMKDNRFIGELSKAVSIYLLATQNNFTITAGSKKATIKIPSPKKGCKYIIYRSSKPDSGYKKVGSTTSTYTDKKLKKGSYYYKVVVCKSFGGKKYYSDYSVAHLIEIK